MENFESVVAELLEVDAVNPEDELAAFECWDSLTILSIIAVADTNYGVTLSALDVNDAKTIGGLKEMIKMRKK
jgi:acyl carrier protein